jgi:hypothetical protein
MLGGNRHHGLATMWVGNIRPHGSTFDADSGGVEFYMHIDWDKPIAVMTDISVLDFPVAGEIVR